MIFYENLVESKSPELYLSDHVRWEPNWWDFMTLRSLRL